MQLAKVKRFGNRLGVQTGAEQINKGKLVVDYSQPAPRQVCRILSYNRKTHYYRCENIETKVKIYIFAEDAYFRDAEGNLLNK